MSFASPHRQLFSPPRGIALALVALTHLGCFQDPPTYTCSTASCDSTSTMTSGGSSSETRASSTSGADVSSAGTGGATSTSGTSQSESESGDSEGQTSAVSSGSTGDTAVDTDDGGGSESGGEESGGETTGGVSASYGDPAVGCLPGEVPATVPGASGQICSPACGKAGQCPPLDPPGPAIPQCALVMDGGPAGTHCILVCDLFAGAPQCPPGSTCKDVGQGQAGTCTYP